MRIDFIPGPATAAALLAGVSLAGWLVLLSHGPWRLGRPGQRFVAAALLAAGSWALLMLRWGVGSAVDLATGGMLLSMAVLAGFTLWTLIAWGFTLSMLLALARHEQGLTLEDWVRAYTHGKSITTFGRDRLGVLFRLGLAGHPTPDRVAATPRGRRLARCAALVSQLVGVTLSSAKGTS